MAKLADIYFYKYQKTKNKIFIEIAINLYTRSLSLNKYDSNYYYQLAWLYSFYGNKADVKKYIDKAILMDPFNFLYYQHYDTLINLGQQRMFKNHFLKIIMCILVSVVLAYLTLRQIDFRRSLSLIKSVNYWFLFPALMVCISTYVLRAIRYYFILLPLKKTKVLENFPYTTLGFFANNIVPLRLGEFIRAKITGKYLAIASSATLATIVIERLFDILIFILFFFLIFFFMPFASILERSFYVLFTIAILCFVVLYIIITHREKMIEILSKLSISSKIKSIIFSFLDKFASGLIILKKPIVLFKVSIMSVIVWGTESLVIVIVAYACGINLSVLGAIFTIIIIGVGSIVPTVPGYFGAFELMGVLSLSALGVDKNLAFTCIAIYHIVGLVGVFTLGFVCIFKTKLSLVDLFKVAETKDSQRENDA
ncbi:MAG: flippase-like domain-containing protein [Endomicrobium sp.]|nr:flippase-like domain-containing protein [Endomicrobium sp.]